MLEQNAPTFEILNSLGIFITNVCNRHCEFCFLRPGYPRELYLSDEDLAAFCDWAARNHLYMSNLLGGEPTLHPNFVRVVQTVHKVVPRIAIVSNLLCAPDKLEGFRDTALLANADSLDQYTEEELALFQRNLEAVSQMNCNVDLACTIWRLDQSVVHLLDYCDRFKVRFVRLDLARPSRARRNRCVRTEQIAEFKPKLLGLARELVGRGIRIGFDCPFPEGYFSAEEIRELRPVRLQLLRAGAVGTCPSMIVNADLTIRACPHAVVLERRLPTFGSFEELGHAVIVEKRARLQAQGLDESRFCYCEAERYL